LEEGSVHALKKHCSIPLVKHGMRTTAQDCSAPSLHRVRPSRKEIADCVHVRMKDAVVVAEDR